MADREVLLRGSWLYGGTVPAQVLVKSGTQPFPSPEDDPDAAESPRNHDAKYYFVIWFEPGNPAGTASEVGSFATLREARAHAESVASHSIRWDGDLAPHEKVGIARPQPSAKTSGPHPKPLSAPMTISRILTNVCADDLAASRDFYVQLLDFEVKYDSDWYVQLCAPGPLELEFGIIKREHELVPKAFQTAPSGMYVTFVVPNVDELYERARAMGARVIQEPRDEFYGQRRFLVLDPAGCLVDICSPWSEQEKSGSPNAG